MVGMGCKVLAYDIVENEKLQSIGVTYLPLEIVLKRSSVISLHCPLNDNTKHLINRKSLAIMKKGAMLINTSRGGLIDTKATIEALKKGKLGYLGIDVYEQEEKLFFHDLSENIIKDDLIMRLQSFPNVLITSHQGFLTDEALKQIALVTLQNITDFEQGKKLENKI
jgi:D-lactate dehydrogenase